MKTPRFKLVFLACFAASAVFAQSKEDEGIKTKAGVFKIDAGVLGAYNDRIQVTGNTFTEDYFSETEAGIRYDNLPALHRLWGYGRYGYRFYNDLSDQNGSFYKAGAGIGSNYESPLSWGLSADVTKSLNYNTSYNPASGQQPDSILTDSPNRRTLVQANAGYDKMLGEKNSLMPSYSLLHYYQEFQSGETAQWQIHGAGLDYRRHYSEETVFSLGAHYSYQLNLEKNPNTNEKDNGGIASVQLAAEGEITDKISWLAMIGYAFAEYEQSGSDSGIISNLRANWNLTEKISAYVFGGNDFQPAYAGSNGQLGKARRVYRLGYGADWQVVEKLGLSASVFHDYQEEIGGTSNPTPNSPIGTVRTFFDAQVFYQLTRQITLSAGYQYNKDEKAQDQQIGSLNAVFVY